MQMRKNKVASPLQIKTKRKQFVYNEFASDHEKINKQNCLSAMYLENCDCSGGQMRIMSVFETYKHPSAVYAVKLTQQAETPRELFELKRTTGSTQKGTFGFTTASGNVYILTNMQGNYQKAFNAGKNPKCVLAYDEEKGQTMMFIGQEGAYMYNMDMGQWCSTESFLPLGCFVKGRVFTATPQGELVFFKPFDVRVTQGTIDETGKVQLPGTAGQIVDMVGVGDYVYVFCEYGIFRVKVAASARQFEIETVPYGGAVIVGSTACATSNGGEIFFLAGDGLCTLKGKTVVRHGRLCNVSIKTNQSKARSMQVDDKYVVYVEDIYSSMSWYAVDLHTKQAYPCTTYSYTTGVLGGALTVHNNYVYHMHIHEGTSVLTESSFQTILMFDTEKEKVLHSLSMHGKDGCRGYVESEYGRKDFYIWSPHESAPIRLKGKKFTLCLHVSPGAVLSGLTAEVTTLQ